MKNKLFVILLLLIFTIGVLVGCSNSKKSSDEDSNTIKVGAALTPHTDILKYVQGKLKEQGINLEIINLDSESELNPALDEGEIDANYFQHKPYLDSVSKEKGYKFSVACKVHIEPMGFYSNNIKSLNELKKGDKIGIPNDSSNEYRALKLLEDNGVIKLKEGLKDYSATSSDIEENPLDLQFVEVEGPQLERTLNDVAGSIISTNVVLEAGLNTDDAIVRESSDSPYANILVVREGDEKRKSIEALVKELNSDDVKNYIKEKYGNVVVPAF